VALLRTRFPINHHSNPRACVPTIYPKSPALIASSKCRLGQDPTCSGNRKPWVYNPSYYPPTQPAPPPPPPPARGGGGFYFSASRSLYPHQPRAWLCHTHLLRTAQILKPRCRVCAVRTHAFYALRQPAPVGINTYPIFPKKQPAL